MNTALRSWTVIGSCAALAIAAALAADRKTGSSPDKYALQIPGGLAFSEFRGYETWSVIAVSRNGGHISAIVGNPVIINAFRGGVPGNGRRFPDGSKMAKFHWNRKTSKTEFGQPTVSFTLDNIDFMVKDSGRFADSGRWGWAVFNYDAASHTFCAGTTANRPPRATMRGAGSRATQLSRRRISFSRITAHGRRGSSGGLCLSSPCFDGLSEGVAQQGARGLAGLRL